MNYRRTFLFNSDALACVKADIWRPFSNRSYVLLLHLAGSLRPKNISFTDARRTHNCLMLAS